MDEELTTEGYGDEVQFLIINSKGVASSVSKLVAKCDFPVFQDTSEVNAWALHGGGKDDIFIYDGGVLATFLPMGGPVSISLTGAGYNNVKNAIMDALDAP